jgi:hypothetical protein
MQGGFRALQGGGVSASAGTHDQGDVFDLSVSGLDLGEQLEVVDILRGHYGCAWIRTPAYGWPASAGGPHIHCVMADSHHRLSGAAQQQVHDYDNGYNGLANRRADPHPRPIRRDHWEEDEMTPEQLDAAIERAVRRLLPDIAKAVWHFMLEDTGSTDDPKPEVYAATILRRIRSNVSWLVRREQR